MKALLTATATAVLPKEATNINSNQGSFNWDSKIATFNGNVMVNGAARQGTVAYNVINKQFQ